MRTETRVQEPAERLKPEELDARAKALDAPLSPDEEKAVRKAVEELVRYVREDAAPPSPPPRREHPDRRELLHGESERPGVGAPDGA